MCLIPHFYSLQLISILWETLWHYVNILLLIKCSPSCFDISIYVLRPRRNWQVWLHKNFIRWTIINKLRYYKQSGKIMIDWEKNTGNVHKSQRINRTKGTLQISKKKNHQMSQCWKQNINRKKYKWPINTKTTNNRTANLHKMCS